MSRPATTALRRLPDLWAFTNVKARLKRMTTKRFSVEMAELK